MVQDLSRVGLRIALHDLYMRNVNYMKTVNYLVLSYMNGSNIITVKIITEYPSMNTGKAKVK